MEGIGSYTSNKISEDELIAIEKTALPDLVLVAECIRQILWPLQLKLWG